MNRKYKLIVPTIPKDFMVLKANIEYLYNFLPITEIVVIGNKELGSLVANNKLLSFYNESDLIELSAVKQLIKNRLDTPAAIKRTGWYVQQFIKMAYARVCKDDYYLLWDSDTIPIQSIELFDKNGMPFLDYKTEYFKVYFETMAKILPGYGKMFEGSFIAEHMLVNSAHMRALLDEIERNDTVEGDSYYQKIINAIILDDLPNSGFSEFETFGTYLFKNHRDSYSLRRWYSMRHGGFFFVQGMKFSEIQQKWLAKSFHAISFEKIDNCSILSRLVGTKLYMCYFSPLTLNVFAFVIKVFRKLIFRR